MFPKKALATALTLAALHAQAQDGITLVDQNGAAGQLSAADEAFIMDRIEMIDLSQCTAEPLGDVPRVDFRQLEVPYEGQRLKLNVLPDVMRTGTVLMYLTPAGGPVEFTNCASETGPLLPILALMVTADILTPEVLAAQIMEAEDEITPDSLLRQTVLAQNSGLTSHESTRLMARQDSDDINNPFMDFKVSSKNPVLPNSRLLNESYDFVSDSLEWLVPGDAQFFLQPYFAFTGRFSQYLETRDSSPVVSRRFNPELFFRLWNSNRNYLDLGAGHESNGQRIDTEERFLREGDDYEQNGEPRSFARDSLSRGWDYIGMSWQYGWNDNIVTQVRLRHFKDDGLLQGPSEEYNLWEDGGSRLRPRRQYDGVSFDLQYNFNQSRCLLGSLPICFSKLQLTQETGYSQMFENNSSTLEFTTDFFGLPIQLWTRTGYNSDLVDYYNYSNSWGIGIELISR